MKSFEEQFAAWVDGSLSPEASAEFEGQLPDPGAARQERENWLKLRHLMREQIGPAKLNHPDFLASQVMSKIASDEAALRQPEHRAPSLGRFAWLGAGVCAAGILLAVLLNPANRGMPTDSEFISQVISSRVADPKISAYAFHSEGRRATVLWIEDAGYIRADQNIR